MQHVVMFRCFSAWVEFWNCSWTLNFNLVSAYSVRDMLNLIMEGVGVPYFAIYQHFLCYLPFDRYLRIVDIPTKFKRVLRSEIITSGALHLGLVRPAPTRRRCGCAIPDNRILQRIFSVKNSEDPQKMVCVSFFILCIWCDRDNS